MTPQWIEIESHVAQWVLSNRRSTPRSQPT